MHKLAENPRSGYALWKDIRSSGQRVSFGSIYPILDRLRKTETVSMKQDGRRKIYTLTQKGKTEAQQLKAHREEIITEMIGKCKTMSELIGQDPEPIVALYERLKKGEDPLAPVKTNLFRLRNRIFLMSQTGMLEKKEKKINAILTKTYQELEKL
jgi:DNA-binding PadR family transcriptional regulator